MIAEVLLDQVSNLRQTDNDVQANLETAGGNLDRVKFVRNKQYVNQMSSIVQDQERELALLNG